jgi:hypothetical protein
MGIEIPSSSPSDNPLTPVFVNPEWLPILIGLCVDNLLFRSYWDGTEGEIDDAIDFSDSLVYLLSIGVIDTPVLGLEGASWLSQSAMGRYQAYEDSNLIAGNFSTPDTELTLKNADIPTPTLIDNAGTSMRVVGDNAGLDEWAAQSFQATEGYLSAIDLRLNTSLGSPSGTITWQIRSDNSGNPSGTILDSDLFSPIVDADNHIPISNGVYLSSGVTYWLVLKCTSVQGSGNAYRFNFNTANPYANGSLKRTTNGGSSWGLVTSGTSDMRVSITTSLDKSKLAQLIKIDSDTTLDTAYLWLRKVGGPTGNLTLKIYSDNSGDPDSVLATSDTIDISTLSTSFMMYAFTFPDPVTLSANTSYWLVLESSQSVLTGEWVEWQANLIP